MYVTVAIIIVRILIDSYTFVQTLKENGNSLQIRPENFEDILTRTGFSPPEHLGRSGEGGKHCNSILAFNMTQCCILGFRRPIDLYRKSV